MELAGGFGLPTDPRQGASNRASASGCALPPATWLLLFVAAAEPTGDPAFAWRAAAVLGVGAEGAAPAAAAGLVDFRRAGPLPPRARSIGGLGGGCAQATASLDEDIAAELVGWLAR